MKSSDPLIKPFRDRPRAVSLFICRKVRQSDTGAHADGISYDFLRRRGESLFACAFVQGRVTTGDHIEAALVDAFRTTVWRMVRQTRIADVTVAAQVSFDLSDVVEELDGEYDLLLRVNGRLAGRVALRIRQEWKQ